MPIYKQQPTRKFPIRFFFFFDIIVILSLGRWMLHKNITLHTDVMIEKGNTFSTFLQPLDRIDTRGVKLYTKLYSVDISKIQLGNYQFSGSYTKQEFFKTIQQGPAENFVRYTVLEGRSIYDIDYDLAQKGYIQAGAYIAYVTDRQQIQSLSAQFPVITRIEAKDIVPVSLEGFLYPDTYFIDKNKDFLQQLVQLQLQTFTEKVSPLVDAWVGNTVMDYNVKITPYQMLTLASVVEKEEKNPDNKPTVAGIFLHRLEKGMRLDADITLCYGLQQPYETCTPSLIAKEIYDTENPFNTRQQAGIPSQPIANPSIESIRAVIEHVKTPYLYYLHDMQGQIYYGATIQEHNENKRLYLK